MKKTGWISFFLAAVLAASCLCPRAIALAADVNGQSISSMGAIVIDFETGMELYAYNADVMRGPASMTKLMTVYLVYEAIANGLIDFDTVVPISAYAADYSRTPGETNVPLNRNVVYTVGQLLDVIVVMSAGGACAALAELIAGTTRAFQGLMNAKAAEWGIDAIFRSVSGGVEYTRLTPRAMATIARHILMDYPEVLEKTSQTSVNWYGREIPATNQLLGIYEGIDGLKTGTHPGTRANFTGTAQRGNIRIISVTMGSTSGRRFPDTTILLDYGFAVMEEYWAAIEARKVEPRIMPVMLNGAEIELESFTIEQDYYFSIRDIAFALDGTKAQFNIGPNAEAGDSVVYDEDEYGEYAEYDDEDEANSAGADGEGIEDIWETAEAEDDGTDIIILTRGAPYNALGDEMVDRGSEKRLPEPLDTLIMLDGEELELQGYDIEGIAFFKLTDMGNALGFSVIWMRDGTDYRLCIDTGEDPPVVEAPPSPNPSPAVVPAAPATPAELLPPAIDNAADNEGAQPVPLPIVLGVVGGLCVIGGGVAFLKHRKNSRQESD